MATEVSLRDFTALEKRVSTLESRVERFREDINQSLGHAKGFDDRLDQKVGELEKRMRRDMKELMTEKDVRSQIDRDVLGKLAEIDRLAESRVKTLNGAMERAKAYDDKLEGMINDLRAKIDRLSRGS